MATTRITSTLAGLAATIVLAVAASAPAAQIPAAQHAEHRLANLWSQSARDQPRVAPRLTDPSTGRWRLRLAWRSLLTSSIPFAGSSVTPASA